MSAVREFYGGKSIFVTGSTGFLGRILIEKLLRTCPDVRQIFLLMRTKKNRTPTERLEDFLNDDVFKPLMETNPLVFKKLFLIEGDVSEPRMAIDNDSWSRLVREVNIIFHIAAIVNFDEKLRNAIITNVQGVRECLRLAHDCTVLCSIVHVSTAFSFCPRDHILEQCYQSPIDPNILLDLSQRLDSNTFDFLTPKILEQWPNTYTYTKALAENLIVNDPATERLPLAIVRPSIVTATFKEPLKGWVNNLNGPTGVVVGASYGVLHYIRGHEHYIADVIPGDIVINGILTIAWKTSVNFEKKIFGINNKPIIYNMVSGQQNPLSWNEFKYLNKLAINFYPPSKAIWDVNVRAISNYYVFYFLMYICQVFPSIVLDLVLKITGKKPKFLKIQRNIYKFAKAIGYFALREWKFCDNNVRQLWLEINDLDRNLFPFNIAYCNWKEYSFNHYCGIRFHLLKDGMETVPDAIRRHRMLKLLNWLTKLTFTIIFLIGFAKIYASF